ncbi:sugar ABC transporter ATP-binding protein [Fodinicola feengrottensis]|uniref:sugar ABC transporter ATP-binding protein n=1 Tax=Fodinicola feengrottensis TaxID=435914 RepID=UPI0024410CC9|nr:sugar ABC transporter ATP-binding protein [Fodinicola feengrottensis]
MPESNSPILAMRDIAKSFPGVRALTGVSMDVRAGEVHALLGENGAGKSTLCNILSGVFTEYAGSIELAGERANIHHPQRRPVARHRDDPPGAQPGARAVDRGQHLPRPGAADPVGHDQPAPDGRRVARRLLAELGLRLDPRRPVRTCQIAEQQLIEVAKALSLNVRVLIMDEPTSALADAEVKLLFAVIRRLVARGVAVIYISHRLEELYEIADRVTVLRDGGYIGTREMAATDRAELIRMMVGRPLGEIFQHSAKISAGAERLRVTGLSLAADPRAGRVALHDVSLSVRAGEIVGLAGLMGAGRTEVLEAIFGVFGTRAIRGSLALDGKPYPPRSPEEAIRRGVALVAEDRKTQSLVLSNTVRFNASLASLKRFRRWSGGVDAKAERKAVAEQVASLRVKTPSLASMVANLSGGNQQKVVLAKCLLTKPTVLLLDEPTRGIDVGAKAEISELVNKLAAAGTGILMASSELPELLGTCDRIIVLCEGRVTAELDRAEATQERILAAAMARQVVLAEDMSSTGKET